MTALVLALALVAADAPSLRLRRRRPAADAGFATMGMPGIPSPTRVGANLVFADVAVNGHPGGRLGVDTGSPVMLVDATQVSRPVAPRPRRR